MIRNMRKNKLLSVFYYSNESEGSSFDIKH